LVKYIIVVIVVVSIVVVGLKQLHKDSPIPPAVNQEANFVIFYPNENSQTKINKASFKYDSHAKALSFIVTYNSKSLTFSEQPTPQGFVDIPQAYDKLIEELNGYSSFDSYYGKVDLTHPKELKGQQSAAMNTKGTLTFVHPTNGDLSNDQWKQLFNNLDIVK
jgi:predicted N-acyltransferase